MPPPSQDRCLHLSLENGSYFVIQLPQNEAMPLWVLEGLAAGDWFSVTRTKEEISVVGQLTQQTPEVVQKLSTWSCIKIAGPMEHNLTGVLASFTAPLKTAGVPVFAISTWNTDYILVPQEEAMTAKSVLVKDGWIFRS